MTDPQVQDVFDQMADYIDEHGWIQGSFGGAGSVEEVCLIGAHRKIFGVTLPALAAMRELFDRTGLVMSTPYPDPYYLTQWNDDPFRTKEQVVGMLRGKNWREL